MSAEEQTKKLADYLMLAWSEWIIDGGAGDVAIEILQAAEEWKAALLQAREALRLTREYVGEELLPAVAGWSWFDATVLIDNLLGVRVAVRPPSEGTAK